MSEAADLSASARDQPAVSDRSNFFDEQKRRRRTGRILSGVCLLIAGGIGVVLSSVVTPLLLLAGGGLLHLLARLGVFPAALREAAHGLGAWARGHSAHFEAFVDSLDHVNGLSDLGVTVAPLLRLAPVAVPALVAACLVWIALRRISLRGEGGDVIARVRARPPNLHDQEERQLSNVVAEMAIAAGLPAPTLLLIDSPYINAAAVGGSRGQASVLVTRGLLDQLDRDETSGVVAHLIASIGAGDIRLTHGILAVFQTFGFFVTFLDLPFRWSAWRALGGLTLVAAGLRRSPEMVAQTLESVERSMDAEAMPDVEKVWSVIPWRRVRLVLLAPLLPLILISLILRAGAVPVDGPVSRPAARADLAQPALCRRRDGGAVDAQSRRTGTRAVAHRRNRHSRRRRGAGVLLRARSAFEQEGRVHRPAHDHPFIASRARPPASASACAGRDRGRWRARAPHPL